MADAVGLRAAAYEALSTSSRRTVLRNFRTAKLVLARAAFCLLALCLLTVLFASPGLAEEEQATWMPGVLSYTLLPSSHPTITRANLVRIKEFILQKGTRFTFSNVYNDNPTHRTERYSFYLLPDDYRNTNCDPELSDFHRLTIYEKVTGYRELNFLDQREITITVSGPRDDWTVQDILRLVEEAVLEIVSEIEDGEPGPLRPVLDTSSENPPGFDVR